LIELEKVVEKVIKKIAMKVYLQSLSLVQLSESLVQFSEREV